MQNTLERARASEEKYRLISRVSTDYVFSSEIHKDGSGSLNWVAGAFEKMTGYTYEEYVASGGWLAHVHPDDLEKDAQDMEKLNKNQDVKSEIRTFIKNGEIRWERIFAHPVWDEKEDRLIGIIGAVQDITENKRSEEALRKSEAIYRQAIEIAGGVPYHQTFDEGGNIHYDFMGEGIRQITGYGPEEFNDSIWGTLMQERNLLEDLAGYSLDDATQRVRSGKNPIWKCEHCIKARDGKIHWVFEAAVDLRDEHGIAHGSVGLFQDITDRKQSEEALKYERDLLQIFMDNIPDTVYLKDVNSHFVRINQAQARFLGIKSPQDAIGKTDLDFQNSKLAKKFMAEEKEIIETGQSTLNHIDFIPTHDGKARWFASTKVPVRDYAGQITGTIGISRDITEQKESQEKLQRIYLQQAAILNSIPDMAWLKDKDSRYIAVNKQFAKTAGMIIEDIIGKTDLEIWHNSLAEKYRIDDLEVMHTRQLKNAEEIQIDSAGKEYWVETIKTPILNADGEVVGTTGIAREITERKKFIADLEAKNAELERFTYTVSHDLKSPLVTIRGFLGYLEQDAQEGDHEKFRHDKQRIENAVEKMQNLLNDLLELSRIGRLMNTPVDISFNEITQDALEAVHGQIEANHVTIEYKSNDVLMKCDRTRMVEVMQNLIDNAIKFMGDQPDPRIEIGIDNHEKGAPIFYVKDNGVGIAPEFHANIFGLFNKLDTDSSGTGIGLALVKRIIEVHGGRIWVESQVGQGTTFYFTLS